MTSQAETYDDARLTAQSVDAWCRRLEATGAVWAAPLGLGGAGALIELRGRARPRPLVGVVRTPGECRAALDALRAAPGAPDPRAALPPALRCTPELWRELAASRRTPAPPAPRPPGAPAGGALVAPRPRVDDRDGGAAGRASWPPREAAVRLRVSPNSSYPAALEGGRRDRPDAPAVAASGAALPEPRPAAGPGGVA
jgi:hypothetical protein